MSRIVKPVMRERRGERGSNTGISSPDGPLWDPGKNQGILEAGREFEFLRIPGIMKVHSREYPFRLFGRFLRPAFPLIRKLNPEAASAEAADRCIADMPGGMSRREGTGGFAEVGGSPQGCPFLCPETLTGLKYCKKDSNKAGPLTLAMLFTP